MPGGVHRRVTAGLRGGAGGAVSGRARSVVRGKVIATVPESAIVETLIEEAMRLAEQSAVEGDGETGSGKPVVTAY